MTERLDETLTISAEDTAEINKPEGGAASKKEADAVWQLWRDEGVEG